MGAPVYPTHLGDSGRGQHWETGDRLENHIELIRRQLRLSLQDPETRSLAVAITSSAFDRFDDPRFGPVPGVPYHGRYYRGARDWAAARALCGMRDELCEITQLWNFWVLNVRYLQDVVDQDTYQTLRGTLESGGGDCFPAGTLLLRDDYRLVPVSEILPGERIWGLHDWTEVEAAWPKGVLPTHQITLNNGSSLRLTPDHKVYVIRDGAERRILVSDLVEGDELVQPDRIACADVAEDPSLGLLEGLYIADGWVDGRNTSCGEPCRFAINGLDGTRKEAQKRLVADVAERLGLNTRWHEKYIAVNDAALATKFARLGLHAPDKQVSTLARSEAGARALLTGLAADADARNGVFTTTSRSLAVQLRVLHRMLGIQTGWSHIVDHGGLGAHPIYRVGPRTKRPWRLTVRTIEPNVVEESVWDITTADHRVYLPEHDVTVSNCDDFTIGLGALCGAVGYPVIARVISVHGNTWDHIYPVVRTRKRGWVALDATERGKVPGWEYGSPGAVRDFHLTGRA